MAQNNFARLDGTKVEITAVTGAFRACQCCGHTLADVRTRGIPGLHAGELRCAACGEHTAWLSRDHLAAMAAQMKGAA